MVSAASGGLPGPEVLVDNPLGSESGSTAPQPIVRAIPSCAACSAVATHTAPFTSHWRRVHPRNDDREVKLMQVPDPPVCERHWEAFLHRERLPIGWCIDCEQYGAVNTASPCGRNFDLF